MAEVDVYKVFCKSLKIKSKFKLTAFLYNMTETKYFFERVTFCLFCTQKTSPGPSNATLRLLLKRAKKRGLQKMKVAAFPP